MNEIEQYILASAQKRGIDPQIALKVARSEGGLDNPFQQSNILRPDQSREQSYGPFQLYMGGGLGNDALAAGIDPRKDWKGGVDFALDSASKGGWGPFHGAAASGISPQQGIGMTLNTPPQIVNGPGGSTISMAPPLPAPTNVADKLIGGLDTLKATLGTFKDDGFLAGMKAMGGADAGGKGFAALSSAFGGGERRDPQAEAHAQPIQSILPAMEGADAQRMQTGQALMAQLLAKKKMPGLSLNGVR